MTGGKKQGGRPSGNKPGGTKPRQKIRITRETGQRRGGESGEDVTAAPAAGGYFDVRPAQLPHWLDSLSALTKPGVRGFPEVDAAQVVLAQTMRKDRVRGEVLDLTAQGGLLASLPGVTLRAVEGAAAALTVLRAAGLDAHAAAPGEDLSGHWPERARTVALVLAGDRGNAYAQAQVAWAHACTPPGGTLYLAGDRDKGFDRYVRQAGAAFGTGEVIARDGGMRVARLIRRPGPTPPLPEPEGYEAFGVRVVGLPGVFSAAKPDKATGILLTRLADLDLTGQRVIDLGCGAGLIGAGAASRGAQVTLVTGPVNLPDPAGMSVVHIESALQLHDAVVDAAQAADVVVMTAAVADYRAAEAATEKQAKVAGDVTIHLTPNPDILAELGRDKGARVLVGFAMETHAGVERAAGKAQRKNADFILLNYPTREGTAFGGDDNQVTLVRADGTHEDWPRTSKREVARRLLDEALRVRAARPQA